MGILRGPHKPSKRGAGLINRFEKCVDQRAFVGAAPPEDRPAIAEEYNRSRNALRAYVARLELLVDELIDGKDPNGVVEKAIQVRGRTLPSPRQRKWQE